MVTERQIKSLNELIMSIQGQSKRNYATNIINKLIDTINSLEKQNDFLKSKKIGVNPKEYDIFIERCVDVLSVLGFDQIDIHQINKNAINFIKKFRINIKKPLTAEYLMTLNNLYNYYIFLFFHYINHNIKIYHHF